MAIANIWGQGQIFAFSALDGKTSAADDFTGILCADRIGIKFLKKVKRELAIVGYVTDELVFDAVCGDYICARTHDEKIRIIYADTNLIVGDMCSDAVAAVYVEGRADIETTDNVQIQNTNDGEFTALATDDNRFAFAYGNSRESVLETVKRGLESDIDAEAEKKVKYYEANQLDGEYSKLYSKCVSVMKTQLYSPEGNMDKIWSTPDRVPHRKMWLWDSVFHAVGYRNLNGEIAEELILSIFANQYENGMIPHAATVGYRSDITQPPVIAWGAWKVYERTGNTEFLKEVFEKNSAFLVWCEENRCPKKDSLYVWHTSEDVLCRCDESGMDNSPRFDNVHNLEAIDFSCFVANEMRYMSKIANEIGYDTTKFDIGFEKIKNAVNEKLWDNEDGFYYDYDIDNNNIHKVKSVASFLPLFTGVCDEEKADKLVKMLTDPNEFYTEFSVPSIAVHDKTFGSDMWRGPVWINYNYMIIQGLKEYGYNDIAMDLRSKTIKVINEWYEKTGTVFEFYDCENKKAPSKLPRKGTAIEPYSMDVRVQSIRDYGWSCTLTCDMLSNS